MIKIRGRFKLVCKNPDGSGWATDWIKNTITNAGLAEVAGLVGATGSPTEFTYLAVGTSSTAPTAADTALGAEITDTGLARKAATVARTTTTVTNDTLRLTTSWTASGSKTVEEIGIFNAASSGDMLAHALTSSRALVNGSLLSVTYDVSFA
jgi:hypothetical protein